MAEFAKEILPVNLEDEMRQSYLDYAMSVIVGRALPDARDGLKPVHRRVLFAMSELGIDWNKAYKKSARVVGDVIGKYHPHGDQAVYDTIVRLAQDFAMRYVLVDGQGNFGSIDGDAPAAMRYTEVRMARLAHELLADLDKETVDFVPNYDETEREPAVFPTRVPNLLVNGSAGIAVGMATNIPPHNLGEVIDACLALLDNPELSFDELIQHVPGPDFPTAGIINGIGGIREAYRTGRGRVLIRARHHVETDNASGREALVFTELPYQVNKARLQEKIAELVKEKRLHGIAELRDESDKDGMRLVVELKRGEVADVLVNNLFQHTQLETVFGINMVALVKGQPRTLNLKELLEAFLQHRREVVIRRTLYQRRKARERAHVLEGLAVALANLDPVIALIREAANPSEARQGLIARAWPPGQVTDMLQRAGAEASRPEDLEAGLGLTEAGYRLSETQARAILDLQLQRLTGLEQDKIVEEYKGLLDRIAELTAILEDPDRLREVIHEELVALKDQFGDTRRTEIVEARQDLRLEDLISDQPVVVTLSHGGYAKAQAVSEYSPQHRGGRGRSATSFKEDDFIDKMFTARTHDTLLCFTNRGRVYWLKVFELPLASRAARGKPVVNLLALEADERITAVLPVREYTADRYVFFATASGLVKKTPLPEFSRPRTKGIIALELRTDDYLIDVVVTDGSQDILLLASNGKGLRFRESEVRAMGRGAAGVRGLRLEADQRVIGLLVGERGSVLLATEHGYGKRTPITDFPVKGRSTQGVIASKPSARNGGLVGAVHVADPDELMLITETGTLVRIAAHEIPLLGRHAQGVRLIRLAEGERLAEVARLDGTPEELDDTTPAAASTDDAADIDDSTTE